MPASRRRPGDHPLLTLIFVALSALVWWIAQPGQAGWAMSGLAVIWVGLLVAAAAGTKRRWWLFIVTWLCFFAAWLSTLSWVSDVTSAGWPALAAYSALYPAVMVVLVSWLTTVRRLRWLPLWVVVGVLGVGLEYIRAEVLFDAWPFHLAGHGLWGTDLVMLASFGGVWACSLVVWSVGGMVGHILTWQPGRRVWAELGPVVIWPVAGWLAASTAPLPLQDQPLRVLAVQTNLPQNNKIGWSPEAYATDVESFIELTHRGLTSADGQVDLVVWPETMVPGLGFDETTLGVIYGLGVQGEHLSIGARLVNTAVYDSGIPWLVGSPTWLDVTIEDGYVRAGQRFNSAVLIDPDGAIQRADKIFLTPFGETMPYVNRWPWLEAMVMDLGASGMRFDLDVAEEPVRLVLDAAGATWRLAVPICFEDAVPSVTRRLCMADDQVDVDAIINISNDGWFGDSDAGRRSHALAAAFRAVELGRPLVRVANTGLSGIYLPDGHTPWLSTPGQARADVVQVPRYTGTTLASKWGNWLPKACLLAVGLLIIIRLAPKGSSPRLSSSS